MRNKSSYRAARRNQAKKMANEQKVRLPVVWAALRICNDKRHYGPFHTWQKFEMAFANA